MAENFDLIFGQSASQQYAWSDSDYQNGWQTVGSTPPTAEQFDALQRRSDMKAKDINDRLVPLTENATHDYRQPSTAYTVGNIAYHSTLPTGWYLECTTAGTSAAGELTISSPAIGSTVSDSTVVWTINSALSLNGGGALTGTDLTWNGDDLGGSAIVAKSLNTNGYIKYASGMIVQWGKVSDFGGGTSKTIDLNIDFSAGLRYVVNVVQVVASTPGTVYVKGISNAAKSSFKVHTDTANSAQWFWMAIGW